MRLDDLIGADVGQSPCCLLGGKALYRRICHLSILSSPGVPRSPYSVLALVGRPHPRRHPLNLQRRHAAHPTLKWLGSTVARLKSSLSRRSPEPLANLDLSDLAPQPDLLPAMARQHTLRDRSPLILILPLTDFNLILLTFSSRFIVGNLGLSEDQMSRPIACLLVAAATTG